MCALSRLFIVHYVARMTHVATTSLLSERIFWRMILQCSLLEKVTRIHFTYSDIN